MWHICRRSRSRSCVDPTDHSRPVPTEAREAAPCQRGVPGSHGRDLESGRMKPPCLSALGVVPYWEPCAGHLCRVASWNVLLALRGVFAGNPRPPPGASWSDLSG